MIYLLSCKQCSKQYVGQTIADFRFRWNNYKDNNRKYQRVCMNIFLEIFRARVTMDFCMMFR